MVIIDEVIVTNPVTTFNREKDNKIRIWETQHHKRSVDVIRYEIMDNGKIHVFHDIYSAENFREKLLLKKRST